LLSDEPLEVAHLPEKRKANNSEDESNAKKVKLDANGLKTKRPGFNEERYEETSYYFENGAPNCL